MDDFERVIPQHAPPSDIGAMMSVLSAIGGVPLVGRTAELHLIEDRIDAAVHAHGGVVVISGEPGVGKTRLAEAVASGSGHGVLRVRCEEQLRHVPYVPFLDLAEQQGKLPGLTSLLTSIPPAGTANAMRLELFEEIDNTLLQICSKPTCILIVDQLEWIDAASADLLRHLVRLSSRGGRAILATMRVGVPEIDSPLGQLLADWNHQRLLFEVPLAPLDRSSTGELVTQLLGDTDPKLREAVFSRTDGLPFFVEEFVRLLVTEGHASRQSGIWQSADPATTPESVMSFGIAVTVLRRLEHLPSETKEALRAASVLGTRCFLSLLAALTECTEVELTEILAPAASARLFRQELHEQFHTPSYGRFTHALIRDALYAAIPREERRALHLRAAEILSRPPVERSRPSTDFSMLAHHAERARAWQVAYDASLAAGDAAMAMLANHDALTHFNRALKLARTGLASFDPATAVDLGYRLVSTLRTTGHLDEAAAAAQEMAQQANTAGNREAEAWAWIQFAGTRTFNYQLKDVATDLERGSSIATEIADEGLLAAALVTRGAILTASGQLDAADRQFQQATPLADRAGNRTVAVQSLTYTGLTATWRGKFREAIVKCEEAVTLAEIARDASAIADARFSLALALAGCADYDDALIALHDLLRLAKNSGESYYASRVPNTVGWVYRELGLVELALPWDERAISEADQVHGLCHFKARANSLLNLSSDLLLLNRIDEAESVLDRASDAVNRNEYMRWRTGIRLILCRGELALARSNPAQALKLANDALTQATTTGSAKHELQAHDLAGRSLAATGQFSAAIAHLERAVAIAADIEYRAGHWRSLGHLADAHDRQGITAAASEHYAAAVQTIHVIAEHLRNPQLRADFLAAPKVVTILTAAASVSPPASSPHPMGLSGREVEVLSLVADGLTNTQIAERLFLSPKTVSSHLVSIFGKLGVTSRASATRFAIENKLV